MGVDAVSDEPNWGWYASADQENYHCGPESTRAAIIQAATADEIGLWIDPATGNTTQSFHIIEAYQGPINLADYFDAADLVDATNDSLSEFGNENGDPIVDLSSVAISSLERTVREAIAKWQVDNNLRLHTWTFMSTRNGEVITLPDCNKDEARK